MWRISLTDKIIKKEALEKMGMELEVLNTIKNREK